MFLYLESNIPTFIIDSPLTLSVNTSFLVLTKLIGKLKNSSGVSIASIGVPAVTFPSMTKMMLN